MRTRPIFHSSDAAIRGHVFCSFLALTMQKYLEDLSRRAGVIPEWKTLLRDLDRLQHVRIRHRDNDWLVRTDVSKSIADLFRHAHIALPPRARQMAPPKLVPPKTSARKRRGRPRRGATSSRISPKAAQSQSITEIRCSSRATQVSPHRIARPPGNTRQLPNAHTVLPQNLQLHPLLRRQHRPLPLGGTTLADGSDSRCRLGQFPTADDTLTLMTPITISSEAAIPGCPDPVRQMLRSEIMPPR